MYFNVSLVIATPLYLVMSFQKSRLKNILDECKKRILGSEIFTRWLVEYLQTDKISFLGPPPSKNFGAKKAILNEPPITHRVFFACEKSVPILMRPV